MDIDTSRSMSSEAAEYLRHAKKCAEAAERTTDPEVREMLLRVVADLTAAALSAASSGPGDGRGHLGADALQLCEPNNTSECQSDRWPGRKHGNG
jgi:hypothetical protein